MMSFPLFPSSRKAASAIVLAAVLLLAACSSSDGSGTEVSAQASADEIAASSEQTEPALEPSAEPTPEPTAERTAEPARDFTAVGAEIQAFVDERGLNGAGIIVVHRDEGVLYHDHFGEFDDDRISLIASSSKMISAGVLLKLQEDGLLDINTPISEYVDLGESNFPVTSAQLISNSSGLVGLGPDLLYSPYICQWLPAEELEACGRIIFGGIGDDDDVVAPDTEFRYGGAQWQVAGAVAEAVSGKPWDQLIDEIYATPCGLDNLGYISLGSVISTGTGYPTVFAGDPDSIDPTENPNIEGGAYVTTGDYGELLLMHLRGGMCGDNEILSSTSIDTMHADRIAAAYDGSAGLATGYGMGWWVDRTTGRISDGGAFGTVPWLDLDDGYGAYLVIEDTSGTGQTLFSRIVDLVHDAVLS